MLFRSAHLRVLDGGSWKDWFTPLLGLVDVAVVSADFALLVLLLRAVEQAALREKRARDGSEDKDEDGSEQDVRPDTFLR